MIEGCHKSSLEFLKYYIEPKNGIENFILKVFIKNINFINYLNLPEFLCLNK